MKLLWAGILLAQTILQAPDEVREARALVGPARDETRDARAFVEVEAPRRDLFAGERVPLRLVFGIEEDFLVHRMVQPFGPRLDVPVQVTWPGADLPEESGTAGSTFAWNEIVRRARPGEERTIDGRKYRTFSVDARVATDVPGTRSVAAPSLGYAYATRFEEGFLSGTTPADRVDAFVLGPGLDLRVLELPDAGRPPEFGGAVGEFAVEAEASPREVDLDGSLRLVLHVRGSGNLETFVAPRWKEIGGFRVLGIVDAATSAERRFEIDLAPFSDAVKQIPAIPFAYFEPGENACYRLVRTQPIDVVVRKSQHAPAALPAEAPRAPDARPSLPPSPRWWIVGALAVVGFAVLLGRRARVRARRIRSRAP